MSSGVFNIPDIAPSISSGRVTSFLPSPFRHSLPAGLAQGQEFAAAGAGRGLPRRGSAFGGIRLIGLPLGDPELVRDKPPFGGDDDTFYPILAFAAERLDRDAERTRMARLVCPATGDRDAYVPLGGLLDRGAEFRSHALTSHGEQVLRRMPWDDTQEAICRAERIEALVLAIDENRSRRVSVHHHALAQFRQDRLA
jgi:hypothetical protein